MKTEKTEITNFSIYISYDAADAVQADQLRHYLVENGLFVTCDITSYNTPNFQTARLTAVKSIRSCDLFIQILSSNYDRTLKWTDRRLNYEYVEAVSYKKRMLLICLNNPSALRQSLAKRISAHPESSSVFLPENNETEINYLRLLEVLRKVGLTIFEKTDISAESNTENFDVFISYKSKDTPYAKLVYDILCSQGLKVFYSKESLPRLGSDEYREQIDLAIDQSRNMVIVASSGEHIMSRWIKYEWGLFLGEKLAGRKKGNLITILAEGLSVENLPISLRNREAIPLVKGEIERLLEFVK